VPPEGSVPGFGCAGSRRPGAPGERPQSAPLHLGLIPIFLRNLNSPVAGSDQADGSQATNPAVRPSPPADTPGRVPSVLRSFVPPGGEGKGRGQGGQARPPKDLERRGPRKRRRESRGGPSQTAGRKEEECSAAPGVRLSVRRGTALLTRAHGYRSSSPHQPPSHRPSGRRVRPPNGVRPAADPLVHQLARGRGAASPWPNTAAGRENHSRGRRRQGHDTGIRLFDTRSERPGRDSAPGPVGAGVLTQLARGAGALRRTNLLC
jgi:hypothetical protein